ncbi:flavin reductase family protein [Actinokineospora sp. G85]|uniref:flavin reductase family protein n=1 Tax=Actinokineospora sp. G85 TaxID=3406626 RepID=UPI003C74B7CA
MTALDAPVADPTEFKAAMAAFASGVTLVTTRDVDGVPHGFTASAFCSVSLDPPLVCVCVAHSARCHPVFADRDDFAISVLSSGQGALALHFASRAEDKFTGMPLRETGGGHLVAQDALAVLECTAHSRHTAGDHTILVGRVRRAEVGAGAPLVFHDRAFHTVAPEVEKL